jgi:hypothetical protein
MVMRRETFNVTFNGTAYFCDGWNAESPLEAVYEHLIRSGMDFGAACDRADKARIVVNDNGIKTTLRPKTERSRDEVESRLASFGPRGERK